MAGPLYTSVGTRNASAGAASIAPAKPTVNGQNGILLAVVTSKNNATHSTATGGWSQIGTNVNSGASFTASLWIAAESAAAPTFTWTGSVACSGQIAYYSDPAAVTSSTIGASTNNTGSTSTHSTSAIVTTANLSLAVYIDVAAANTALTSPGGVWTQNNDTGSATDAGRTTFGSQSFATSGTSSGAISVTGANAAWVQWQVEVLEVAATAGFETSKAEAAAWYEPPDGFDTSKAEVAAWYEPPSGFDTSKVEVGAWLDVGSYPTSDMLKMFP